MSTETKKHIDYGGLSTYHNLNVDYIKKKVSGSLRIKGSVPDKDFLPTSAEQGDIYYVISDNLFVVLLSDGSTEDWWILTQSPYATYVDNEGVTTSGLRNISGMSGVVSTVAEYESRNQGINKFSVEIL